jgi:antitoxin HicB
VSYYSSLDYPVELVRDDGVYVASHPDLAGCVSMGETPNEAVDSLNQVRTLWLEGQLANGSPIPEPSQVEKYSGKFVLRIPKGLHRLADYRARREGVSLNSYITYVLAGALGFPLPENKPQGGIERAERGVYENWCRTNLDWEIERVGASTPNEIQGLDFGLAHFIVAVAKQIGSHNKSAFKLGECEDYHRVEKESHPASK